MKVRFFLLLLLGGWAVSLTPGISAADSLPPLTFTVNSAADAVDVKPGNGKCETKKNNGVCTLRAAIQESNALPGSNTVILPAKQYVLTIAGTDEDNAASGDLDIKGSLTIRGMGTTKPAVDGGSLDRVIQVFSGHITVRGVIIQNGHPTGSTLSGGGIENEVGATLVLTKSQVRNSITVQGGGIYNKGTLKLKSSRLFQNIGQLTGGGLENNSSGNVSLNKSTVDSNLSVDSGGGILNFGTLTVIGSTLSNNSRGKGGGITNAGNVTLTNSTISGNHSLSDGGGIYQRGGTLSMSNVTVASNQAGNGFTGGGIFVTSGNVTARNSIIADNTVIQSSPPFFYFNDCAGTLNSANYNLFYVTTGCTILGGGHDWLGVDPNLGVLQDNGGPTQTMALVPPSPAIDGGNKSGCTNNFGATLKTDQRGKSRTTDGDGNGKARCDIGAFELQP